MGIVFSGIWGFVAALSLGLPVRFCQIIDHLTFQLFSTQIHNMANGFYYDTDNSDMPTVIFLILFGIMFAMYMWLIARIDRTQWKGEGIGVIIFFAVLLRLIMIPSEPIHENDFYRYLWDGKSFSHGINPYQYAPSDLFMVEKGYTEDHYDDYYEVTLKAKPFTGEDHQRLDRLIKLRDEKPVFFSRIGHWQVPTIYPPVTELIFLISTTLRQDSYYFIKFVFILFDIGVFLIIIALLKHVHLNPSLSLIYGWSPLVIKEIANTGHYDSIPIFFTMLSLLLLLKRREIGSMGVLALATLSKFFPAVLLPLYMRRTRINVWFIFPIMIIGSYLPFLLWDQIGFHKVFEGLMTYNKDWSYNSSLFSVVWVVMDFINSKWTDTLFLPKIVAGIMYLIFLCTLYLKKERQEMDLPHQCFLALAGLFLISPVGDPWYFCWSIPFLCLFPYRSFLCLSGLLILSYLNFQADFWVSNQRILNIPLVSWFIYVPFFVFLAYEMISKPKFCKELNPNS